MSMSKYRSGANHCDPNADREKAPPPSPRIIEQVYYHFLRNRGRDDDVNNPKTKLNQNNLAFFITFIPSLIVYLTTVAPSIAGGDSGELVAEGCKLGTAHPPGYPLYTIVMYCATRLAKVSNNPTYSEAFFANTTSCFFGAMASGLLASSIVLLLEAREEQCHQNIDTALARGKERRFQQLQGMKKKPKKVGSKKKVRPDQESSSAVVATCRDKDEVRRLTSSVIHITTATIIGLLHTSSPLVWQYSTTAEVFALHNLFVLWIVYATIQFAIQQSVRTYIKGAFVCGLALTNQHTSILLSVPLIMWVIYSAGLLHRRTQRTAVTNDIYKGGMSNDNDVLRMGTFPFYRLGLLLLASVSFLSSFIILYATLPLFAVLFPHTGSWGNVTSLVGFIDHFRRKDYGSLQLFSGNDVGSENMWARLYYWGRDFCFEQATPFVTFSCLVGCVEVILNPWRYRGGNSNTISQDKKNSTRNQSGNDSLIRIAMPLEGAVGVDVAILGALLFYLFVFHTLANLPLSNPLYFGIHQRFWMHPNALCFLFAGVGLSKIIKQLTSRRPDKFHLFILLPTVFALHALWYGISLNDQSDNYYFRNYAASILSTLPTNSLLFINYDQQWTSVRYLQECEGMRDDVTSINISMMSYKWWQSKRELYPDLHFPGTYYTMTRTLQHQQGGFSFKELIDSNYDSFGGNIFIGGHLSYEDPEYSGKYKEIPHGIVRRVTKMGGEYDTISAETYRKESSNIWGNIKTEHSIGLPKKTKYGEDTWESTIVREFFDHFVSRATHLLDLAVSQHNALRLSGDSSTAKLSEEILNSIVEACVWLELAQLNDGNVAASPSLWKNLGVAYMHMVRSKTQTFPSTDDMFGNKSEQENLIKRPLIDNIWWDGTDGDWKVWASNRWAKSWNHFLEMKDAKLDPSYEQVEAIYKSVMEKTSQ